AAPGTPLRFWQHAGSGCAATIVCRFSSKAKAYLVSLNGNVAIFKCGQAVAFVLLCIFVVPNTDQRRLQKMNDSREHPLTRQTAQGHVLLDLLANRGQCVSECDDVFVLRAF